MRTDQESNNEYPKLVRDNIPEFIQSRGLTAKTRTLDDKEFWQYLLRKMVEESTELSRSVDDSDMQEELADILELITSIIKFKGWNLEDIQAVQTGKREKNGGFEKRILLLEKP
ncbi:MAG: nucleoside triphosphate pyrophosphohydrolase [Candidatus Doudnabacteria bacterium]|nr:nucleoside triphosphate pyrophosphohydrolase [Candidatus Doudnabacteria bacterium]